MTLSRMTQRQFTQKISSHIHKNMRKQEDLYRQVSSNRRIQRPSDDPSAMRRILSLRSQMQESEDFTHAAQEGENWVNSARQTMDQTLSVWKRINEIAIAAVDGSKSQSDRQVLRREVDQLLGHLVDLSNSSRQGHTLFSGRGTDRSPFHAQRQEEDGAILSVSYQGDHTERKVQVGPDQYESISVLGSNEKNRTQRGGFIDVERGINLFETAIQLRDQLSEVEEQDFSQAKELLKEVERGNDHLILVQTDIDLTQGTLQRHAEQIEEGKLQLENSLNSLQEPDIARLMVELNDVQTTYEAALKLGARMGNLQGGLLDYI